MRTLISTIGMHPGHAFARWRQAICERIVPVDLTDQGDRPFLGTLESTEIGSLPVARITQGAIRTEATAGTIRHHDKHDTITVGIVLDGVVTSVQDDREAVQRSGEIVVLDRRPTVMSTDADSRSLILEVPRARLERMLGSPRAYSALTIGSGQASTPLVTGFFLDLVRVHRHLPPDTADRMASTGIDLLVAGIAERLAAEVPRSVRRTLLMQRAKAHVEANLGDPGLDPIKLAAGVGVSVRRLQELFQEDRRTVADWIWQRRLETAASRLSSPGYRHLTLGVLAFGCGFASQSHFSRRFKDRYGMTPGEYRHSTLPCSA